MKKRKGMSLWLVLPALALSFGALTFATTRILHHPVAGTDQNSAKAEKPNRNAYVRRAQLSPRLALNLSALGNRLEQPGQERLILMGNLRLGSEAKREFAAFLEFPDRLRMSFGGPKDRLLIFNGQQTLTPATSDDLD